MTQRLLPLAALGAVAAILIGCSSAGATAAPTVPPATAAPATAAPATAAPATAAPASAAAAGGAAIKLASVGSLGSVLVAGSNGMTVYTFAKDVKDSGKSACSGGCLTTWPALTVPAGTTPAAGDGITGTIGTITRADDGTTQVTYNGLPLYFFSKDTKPGDGNGVYTNWAAVKP